MQQYNKEQTEKLLKCHQCELLFDKPYKIPCSFTICSRCITNCTMKIEENKLACILCSKIHDIPDSGFPLDNDILSLMQNEPSKSNDNSQLEFLIEAQTELKQFKFYINNQENKIHDYSTELKRLVQLKSEEKIAEINKINEFLIFKIDEFTSENVQNLKINKKFEYKNEIDQLNAQVESYLAKSELNNKELQEAKKTAYQLKKAINSESFKLEICLFGDKMLGFETNDNLIDENCLGKFCVARLTIDRVQLAKIDLNEKLKEYIPVYDFLKSTDKTFTRVKAITEDFLIIVHLTLDQKLIVITYDLKTKIWFGKKILSNIQSISRIQICNNLIAIKYLNLKYGHDLNFILLDQENLNIIHNINFFANILGSDDEFIYFVDNHQVSKGSAKFETLDWNLEEVANDISVLPVSGQRYSKFYNFEDKHVLKYFTEVNNCLTEKIEIIYKKDTSNNKIISINNETKFMNKFIVEKEENYLKYFNYNRDLIKIIEMNNFDFDHTVILSEKNKGKLFFHDLHNNCIYF